MKKPCLTLWVLILSACSTSPEKTSTAPITKASVFPEEVRLANIKQLTSSGTNAEAYWSFDGSRLTYQHRGPNSKPTPACDQIYSMNADDGSDVFEVSNLKGRTTCSYYGPDDSRILYSSTDQANPECPPAPDHSQGYVWPLYQTFQIYSAAAKQSLESGQKERERFLAEPGAPKAYNAELTACKDGKVVFTSDRGGDLDLYVGRIEPATGRITEVKQVTFIPGYDGGAFFSQDCSKLVWRASRPKPGKELDEYQALLKKHLVKPSRLEIWVADADGKHARQVTDLGAASFAPYYTPDQKRILFASNPRDKRGRMFDLYLIRENGTGLERVTFSDTFESFPMFSPDGKKLAFSSNRNNREKGDTNVFIADWVETQGKIIPSSADRFFEWVEKLASPDLQGRGPGTAGSRRAEELVADEFKAIGLKPLIGGSYFQDVKVDGYTQRNVIGSLGTCDQNISALIGAHLDHLGVGGEKTFFGADDNASGVAAILEAARALAPEVKKTCAVFAAFTGEEKGAIGSSVLAKTLQQKKIHIKAMLNLDMVGRMTENRLIVFGADTALEWKSLLQPLCTSRDLDCKMGGDGYGPSDQMPFYQQGIPVLHFFSGQHPDHHEASDTVDKINATGGAKIAALAADTVRALLKGRTTLQFQKPTGISQPLVQADKQAPSDEQSAGAFLGTIPDYVQLADSEDDTKGREKKIKAPPGVRLSGARADSPAAKAGILEGDILIGITKEGATLPTPDLKAFTEVLRRLRPEDPVVLEVFRGGQTLKLPAVIGRKQRG